MLKGNPAAAGPLTLWDCPFDANTSKAFGGNGHRLICMLCGVRIKIIYLIYLGYLIGYGNILRPVHDPHPIIWRSRHTQD